MVTIIKNYNESVYDTIKNVTEVKENENCITVSYKQGKKKYTAKYSKPEFSYIGGADKAEVEE